MDSEPEKKPPDSASKSEKDSWIDRLAERSAGLAGPDIQKRTGEKSPWSYAGLGFQFVGTTLVFAFIGYYLDKHYGWSPWGVIACTMIGLIGGFYLMVKEAFRDGK
jgi:F0F1-type ATP synthase assembly protein I